MPAVPPPTPDAIFQRARARMVERHLVRAGVTDARVLAAMGQVPREHFVPPDLEADAYRDRALPIACGQTISQPYVVALMLQLAEIGPDDRVLDVGTGSGYGAAVASRIARSVVSVERVELLTAAARSRLRTLGYDNVRIEVGDGSLGWPAEAPYDAILVGAAAPAVPPALRQQLAEGGRLVMPIGGDPRRHHLVRLRRRGERYDEELLDAVSFVPLIGAQGWRESPTGEIEAG